jgi:hypothetical protein|tara:strand:- start:426 stop:944 length:519 start_codon:yes stop_codon:yes gene_type:complete
MPEQIYMKLQDKVTRPKLTKENINRNNKSFKHLVDQYERWCKEGGGNEPRSTYEEDIIKCLFEFDLDGYHLAEFLKEEVYIEPDSNLVDILDESFYVKNSLTREILEQWVKENFLDIPHDVIGKKANAKQGYHKYENHYITTIKPKTYEVTLSETSDRPGGYVIGFENITIL